MFESIGGCDALGWVDSQHAVDEVLGFRRYCVPFWSRILKKSGLRFEINTQIENAASPDIVYLQCIHLDELFNFFWTEILTKSVVFTVKHFDVFLLSVLLNLYTTTHLIIVPLLSTCRIN